MEQLKGLHGGSDSVQRLKVLPILCEVAQSQSDWMQSTDTQMDLSSNGLNLDLFNPFD